MQIDSEKQEPSAVDTVVTLRDIATKLFDDNYSELASPEPSKYEMRSLL